MLSNLVCLYITCGADDRQVEVQCFKGPGKLYSTLPFDLGFPLMANDAVCPCFIHRRIINASQRQNGCIWRCCNYLAYSLNYQNPLQMHDAPVILDLCGIAMSKVTLYPVTHWQSTESTLAYTLCEIRRQLGLQYKTVV